MQGPVMQRSNLAMRTCSCCSGARKVKKGLWSPEEDQKLKGYISKHGYKAWSQVPIQAGLERCGKSCRLRWLNYLRPDLKRGDFSAEEQQLIFELQAAYGNRWSWIAKWMPGRTDNEIKNFWNVNRSAKNYKTGEASRFRLAVPFRFDISDAHAPVRPQLENVSAQTYVSNSHLHRHSSASSMDDLISDISLSDGTTVQEFMSWGDLIQPDLLGSIFQL